MKNKKRILWVIGIIIATIILIIIHSITGNPISNALARKAAQQHLDTNYSELNLQILNSSYNLKLSEYCVIVHSLTSVDTTFVIYIDSFGNVVRDEYEYEVANNYTTLRRLEQELKETAQKIIGSKLNYDLEHISLSFTDNVDLTKLERDMILDIHNPPLPLIISATIFSDDVSYNKIAEVAKTLEAALQKEAIPVSAYSVRVLPLANKVANENQAVSWKNSLDVNLFPAEKMNEKNLPEAMEKLGK